MIKNIELYEDFFQESKSYYLEKLDNYEKGRKISFNFSAFLFGFFWLIFRKMYTEAIVIIGFFFVEGYIENAFLIDIFGVEKVKFLSFVVSLFIIVLLSLTANLLYIRKAKRVVENALNYSDDLVSQKKLLKKKGGTNFLIVIIVLIIFVALMSMSK